jgi:hypothetical protein
MLSGTGMKLFFYPYSGAGNPTGKILQVQIRVRVDTTRQVRTRCHLRHAARNHHTSTSSAKNDEHYRRRATSGRPAGRTDQTIFRSNEP